MSTRHLVVRYVGVCVCVRHMLPCVTSVTEQHKIFSSRMSRRPVNIYDLVNRVTKEMIEHIEAHMAPHHGAARA